jgi:hypothetical protein
MVMLDSVRRGVPVPSLARWLLGLGIAATLAANVAHGLGHGPTGAAVGAWPAVALVGSYELLMMIVRGTQQTAGDVSPQTEQAAQGRRMHHRPKLPKSSPTTLRPVACHRFASYARDSTWDSHALSWCAHTSPRLRQVRSEPGMCKRPRQNPNFREGSVSEGGLHQNTHGCSLPSFRWSATAIDERGAPRHQVLPTPTARSRCSTLWRSR